MRSQGLPNSVMSSLRASIIWLECCGGGMVDRNWRDGFEIYFIKRNLPNYLQFK
ncbi:hypothetical protein DFA_01254 [Cavenderia fasciculata]|uniref:Uncharacterized protein n=1 Tax=Cavenderia fasciculata TaxID=261658 RepID=F4PRT7_CACFS|nr:uncharacterized protein DFA_01254 [Cavenderia fasciculata]EGG21373.1 hypothetical protein DFA_01254 [Cavenderia fasciculata]|eukprot:XP_004359223.1 hypothetical protein DFA_01254 [Cavenderia fasciculata]